MSNSRPRIICIGGLLLLGLLHAPRLFGGAVYPRDASAQTNLTLHAASVFEPGDGVLIALGLFSLSVLRRRPS